mgnify:CR=1 FL=1
MILLNKQVPILQYVILSVAKNPAWILHVVQDDDWEPLDIILDLLCSPKPCTKTGTRDSERTNNEHHL